MRLKNQPHVATRKKYLSAPTAKNLSRVLFSTKKIRKPSLKI